MYKSIVSLFILTLSFSLYAAPAYLTMDSQIKNMAKNMFDKRLKAVGEESGITIYEIDEEAVLWLTIKAHQKLKKCGGFFYHDSLEEAQKSIQKYSYFKKDSLNKVFANYSIDNKRVVSDAISKVEAVNIQKTIEKLSSFNNRYYESETGVEAARWIAKSWEQLTSKRSDAKVELYQHSKWKQPSVILTIEGEDKEVVIIGGHLDSIAGFWGGARARAPGADDNASGIATITEIIRVLVEKNVKPKKTLKFMGYAAEEVGLRGSKEIAASFKRNNIPVVGVLQLDMTNFNGSPDIDLVIITDHTNGPQNDFLKNLLNIYLPELKYEDDQCGYACSDHASWHAQGYPASMPFEARNSQRNRKIHTNQDTISRSQGHAQHAAKFAKLGLAFVLEIQ